MILYGTGTLKAAAQGLSWFVSPDSLWKRFFLVKSITGRLIAGSRKARDDESQLPAIGLIEGPLSWGEGIVNISFDRRKAHKFFELWLASNIVLCSFFSQPLSDSRRPNIILIMADDLGYECLGSYGGTSYQTPILDKLAETGVRFAHCYSQPLCSPSRVKIMTGRYNFRNYSGWAYLDPSEITFGNVLKQAGYRTCIAGKWQLGEDADAPRRMGL